MPKTKKNPRGSRVALYARVSTEEQAGEEHFSIDAQFAEMREMAAKKGWDIVGEFVDEGISGTKRNRPQLEAALAMAHNGGLDIIMVHELSRLSRSVYHTLDIFDTLGKLGVGFASVRDPDFDFADPSKRLFLTIIAAINEYYITALSQHTKKAKRERTRQGLYNASSMPYGYEHTGDARTPAVVIPKEAAIVRMAFESYSSGRYSDQDIAELINKQGYRARSGRRFSKDTISWMLSHPFYMGKTPYRDAATGITEIYDGQHEPIIAADLWEKVQEVRASRRTLSRAVQKKYRVYLLSNLAVCDACGRTLRGQSSNKEQYYREMSNQRGYADCPHQSDGVRAEHLDSQIHELIKRIELPKDWMDEVLDQVEDDEQLTNLRRQRDLLEAERHRLQQMRIEGDFDDTMETYREEMDRVRREIANLPTYDQIETIRVTGKAIEDLYEAWETADPADKHDMLRQILREVRVDVYNARVTSIVPLASFLSVFRKIPILAEHEFGEFIPLWDIHQITGMSKIRQVPPLTEALDQSSLTLPFFSGKPYFSSGDASRKISGIADAMQMIQGVSDLGTARVMQIVLPGQEPLPMDLRRWSGASGEQLSMAKFGKLPRESVDVVVSQFMLWENAVRGGEVGSDMLDKVQRRMRPGGVWYFMEMLPQDFPAHWLYRFLPAAWQWARTNTWSLYTLYNQLLASGFSAKVKRSVYYQPVSVLAAHDILTHHPGFAQVLTDGAVEHALERLKGLENQDELLPSEFTVIEGWAQKNQG